MHRRILKEVQVETYRSDPHRKRHKARLAIVKKTPPSTASPLPKTLKPLSTPVVQVVKRSKRGELRTLILHNWNAAVMLARLSPKQPFSILTRLKSEQKWQRFTGTLQGGPLHHSVNVAQEFLLEHGKGWESKKTGFYSRPSKRILRLLDYFDINTPNGCSACVASALIHAHHFARDFDAAFQSRPRVNGFEARELSFDDLWNSQ